MDSQIQLLQDLRVVLVKNVELNIDRLEQPCICSTLLCDTWYGLYHGTEQRQQKEPKFCIYLPISQVFQVNV